MWVCYHDNSKLCELILTKRILIDCSNWAIQLGKCSDHLQLIKFWPSHAPGKGVCDGVRNLCSACSVCVSSVRLLNFILCLSCLPGLHNIFHTPKARHSLCWKYHYGMLYQGLTSHSTQYRSFRRRGPWAVMYISYSVMEGQRHNKPLNPRCFCLQRPKKGWN